MKLNKCRYFGIPYTKLWEQFYQDHLVDKILPLPSKARDFERGILAYRLFIILEIHTYHYFGKPYTP